MLLSGLQTKFRTGTLQGSKGKSFYFLLKPVSQANSFYEIDTISSILLALGLMEWYIDTSNLTFPSSIRGSLSEQNRFCFRDPSCKVQSM